MDDLDLGRVVAHAFDFVFRKRADADTHPSQRRIFLQTWHRRRAGAAADARRRAVGVDQGDEAAVVLCVGAAGEEQDGSGEEGPGMKAVHRRHGGKTIRTAYLRAGTLAVPVAFADNLARRALRVGIVPEFILQLLLQDLAILRINAEHPAKQQ